MGRTELRTEIEINAPPQRVFAILADFERYPEWNPFITSVAGTLAEHERVRMEISLPEGKTYRLRPELLKVTPGEELRWRGVFLVAGLLDVEHFFLLSPKGESATRVVQGEDFSGRLLRFMTDRLTLTARGLVYMNEALRKRAEAAG
jgi:hypothetical protein